MNNETKVKMAAFRIAFLMQHQYVNPDSLQEALNLYPTGIDKDTINRDSPEYVIGAMEALSCFINMLKGKGPQIEE